MSKEDKEVKLFSLEIIRIGRMIKLHVYSGGKRYLEYNTFNPSLKELNTCVGDLTIASSFMSEILLKYLRKAGRKIIKRKLES